MQVIDRELLAQLVGGFERQDDDGGDGGGGGWGGGGGGGGGPTGGGSYDIMAIGIENGAPAVVRITGVSPQFDNTAAVSAYGPGEAPWEGSYLGVWTEPAAIGFQHASFDGALTAAAARVAGAAATAFVEGALVGAGVGSAATPIGSLAGLAIGAFVGTGAYFLLQNDHPKGHFVQK